MFVVETMLSTFLVILYMLSSTYKNVLTTASTLGAVRVNIIYLTKKKIQYFKYYLFIGIYNLYWVIFTWSKCQFSTSNGK